MQAKPFFDCLTNLYNIFLSKTAKIYIRTNYNRLDYTMMNRL